ncbi:hypothetical protein HDU97_008245, partial [Phlyctochytrium planicorne]
QWNDYYAQQGYQGYPPQGFYQPGTLPPTDPSQLPPQQQQPPQQPPQQQQQKSEPYPPSTANSNPTYPRGNPANSTIATLSPSEHASTMASTRTGSKKKKNGQVEDVLMRHPSLVSNAPPGGWDDEDDEDDDEDMTREEREEEERRRSEKRKGKVAAYKVADDY